MSHLPYLCNGAIWFQTDTYTDHSIAYHLIQHASDRYNTYEKCCKSWMLKIGRFNLKNEPPIPFCWARSIIYSALKVWISFVLRPNWDDQPHSWATQTNSSLRSNKNWLSLLFPRRLPMSSSLSLSLSLSSYTHTLCYFQNNNSGFSSVNFIKLFSVSSFPTLSHVQSISLSITLSSCLLYPFALLSCVGTQTLFQ